jgi:hypothetical protein
MSLSEVVVEGTLKPDGTLELDQKPNLLPGPVRVTIRPAQPPTPQRGLADVVREIAADQRARGYPGRSDAELRAAEEAALDEDAERDRELNAARGGNRAGGP